MPPQEKRPADARGRRRAPAEDIKAIVWRAADKLRGPLDMSRYSDVLLGLIFLKFLSDAFEERRREVAEKLTEDGVSEGLTAALLEDRSVYSSVRVHWIPEPARWASIVANTESPGLDRFIGEAMEAIMRENASLADIFPPSFGRDLIDRTRLAEVVLLVAGVPFTGARRAQETLGEVYEYLLDRFARAEGRRGGEFSSPPSVVRLIVQALEPYGGKVYDPACGAGGLLVEAVRFAKAHGGGRQAGLTVLGQEISERTWRLARMNLVLHRIDGDLSTRWADTLADDRQPSLQADFVMSAPPFNIRDWSRDRNDVRWEYGLPPTGNANYAWLQHVLSKTGEGGSAGIVLANGSMTSRSGGEYEIRRAMVEGDVVACMIALPSQLFRSTQIPACLWLLAKDKSPQSNGGTADRRGQILFVDARESGVMADRTERVLAEADLRRIADVYHAWRGTASARAAGLSYENEPGFCHTADVAEVRERGYVLAPGRYVSAPPVLPRDRSTVSPIDPATLMRDVYALFR
ncbi:N-6 DNA methylase [Streptomyces microflavus]|uniref:type I restriction-modification system subunit M n=1 Tax=Streptomyces microflavus TaxID=1919 RepID=UPI0037A851B2